MVDATPSPTSLTELLEEWQRRTPVSLTDWASFEELPSYDRGHCMRAWNMSRDPFAMLLFLALMYPYEARTTCVALASCMSFLPSVARLAAEQREWETGTRLNGPSTFRFSALAQRTRAGLREVSETQRGELSQALSAAVRETVPDPYVFYEAHSPTLAASRDRDRNRALLACNAEVRPKNGPQQRCRIREVAWNHRHGCWTYAMDDDTAPTPRRFAAEELELAI
jgi:hypothetical protein